MAEKSVPYLILMEIPGKDDGPHCSDNIIRMRPQPHIAPDGLWKQTDSSYNNNKDVTAGPVSNGRVEIPEHRCIQTSAFRLPIFTKWKKWLCNEPTPALFRSGCNGLEATIKSNSALSHFLRRVVSG